MAHTETHNNSSTPSAARALFFIQIFSNLSFSVLYGSLILYATKSLHLNDTLATSITGSFIALNYFLQLLGGYIGGRFLSYRSLFCVGMLSQVIGCALISVLDTSFLLWGLAAFLGGSGLNATCINCMVTQLFEPEDKNRETAFLWNYSGMNIGFFVGFTISGYFHLHAAYHQLFMLSACGNILALTLAAFNWRLLKDRDTSFVFALPKRKLQMRMFGLSIVLALVFLLRGLLHNPQLCTQLISGMGISIFIFILLLTARQKNKVEQRKLFGFIFLTLSSLIFWALYQLAPMGLNLFVERNVDRHFLGFIIAPQWIQNINTIVIIIGGPLLSIIFSRMRARGINLNIPLQFSLALLLIGVGFAILPLGISFANSNGFSSFTWILASYIFQSAGELFISPIGYAMVGQLVPVRLRGLMMGVWMMIVGLGAILSDWFSKMALHSADSLNPTLTNSGYSQTFGLLGWGAIIASLALFALIPFLTKLTQENNSRGFREASLKLA